MCGINGFTFSDPERLRQMHAATRHRGPDDEGFFESPQVSFAHNRLSIIDVSPAGHQPMTFQDGRYTIIFNGEIYNYKDIKRELEGLGEQFRSQSDTEVLLAVFARWGEDGLKKLNGIFAFAIWDRDQEKLTIVRDQIGVKPLYYFFDGSRLIFSSELKALLVHDIPRELDLESLNLYFRFLYVPGERTMFKGIKKLAPGSVITFQRGQFLLRKWWTLQEGIYLTNKAEAIMQIRETTKQAVRRQLVSDRPLGVFLSGGIDSSCILGIMAEQASGPLKTFSVGYETAVQSERYNADASLAEKTAAYFGAEHHAFTLTPQQAVDSLEKVAWHMDEPISNHVQSSTYLLAQYAKPEITVALGGDGGDELFGGYSRYWHSRRIDLVRSLPIPARDAILKKVIGDLLGKQESALKFLSTQGVDRFLSFMMQKEEMVSHLIMDTVNRPDVARTAFAPYFHLAWRDAVNQHMAVDVQTWLPDESLLRTDKLTMAHGLEERVPLLDRELVELAFRIPSKWKVGNQQQGKKIFIDAMDPYLPPFVKNQEKRAWMSPMAKWIRGPLLPFIREVLSPNYTSVTHGILNFDGLQKLLDTHVSGGYVLNELWAAVTFQMWAKVFLEGVTSKCLTYFTS